MLIAEMLLLAVLSRTGGVRGRRAVVKAGLAGALLAELALGGQLTTGKGGTLRATGARPGDELLADVHDAVRTGLDGRNARAVIGGLSGQIGGTWTRVAGRLVRAGVLGRYRPLAVLPARYPLIAPAACQAVLDQVRAAAASPGPLPPRIAVLVSIAGRCRVMKRVAPDRDIRRELVRRLPGRAAPVTLPAGIAAAISELLDAVTAAARSIDSSYG